MPKRRDTLDDLLEIGERSPQVALALAAAMALLAAFGERIVPAPWGAFAPLLWVFVAALLVGAIVGAVRRYGRERRFRSQRTVEDLHAMSWRAFELLVSDTYRHLGFGVREGTGQRDGGVDLVLVDPTGRETLVQCKQYRTSRVGEPRVREFYGAMAAHGIGTPGVFVTCGGFTEEARRFAAGKPIDLVDGDRLMHMILATNGGGQRIEEEATRGEDVPECPRCKGPMVRRVAKAGPNPGTSFWGCASFPRCRGTRQP
ncbi:MAG: restriction endonuclease [Alphaproteobacteria bacterium]|nr:MAG: restriction endonuclease [Alphaproteobacteria bacterium]